MLITEAYRKLNAQKHSESERFGAYGHYLATQVRDLARQLGAASILDYGCGKRTLERALGFAIANYDPAIPGCEASPEPADLVVCTDVLEHVEPECLEAVLDDLRRVTRNTILITVDTRPAHKILADGRNAHLIVEPSRWWLPHLMARFDLVNFVSGNATENFFALMRRRADLQ